MPPEQPEKRERPHLAYERAIAPLSTLSSTSAKISQESIRESWRALTLQFGGFTDMGDAFNALNLELKLKFGLVAENAVNCHVEIKIDGQELDLDIDSSTVGLGTKLLQPSLPTAYTEFLEQHAAQQIKDGFKFVYQYGRIGEHNPLADFWTQIVDVIVSNIDEYVVQVKFAGNRLNPFAVEVLRLTVSLSINTVLENYFFNRQVPENQYRQQFINTQIQQNEGFIDPSRIHNAFELAYFKTVNEFTSSMRRLDYTKAHDALTTPGLASNTDLARMYRHYLTTRTHAINNKTQEITEPSINSAMMYNYNPAVLLTLANYLWDVLKSSNLAPGVTDQQKRSYVIERVLGYQEVVGMQNQLLTDAAKSPIALDMSIQENQRIITDALDNFMRIYFA